LAEFGRRVTHPIKPKPVKDGPVKDVVVTGEEVDLTKLPIHLQHCNDGGPYISSGIMIVRDAYSDSINTGIYRHMFMTEKELGAAFNPSTRTGIIHRNMMTRGKTLEAAIVIGVHPLDMMATQHHSSFPDLEVMGGLREESVELVKCETIDLEVPSNAEIVLEGEIPPSGAMFPEGPYGEFHACLGGVRASPVFQVKAITHRKHPIFQSATIAGKHFYNSDTLWLAHPVSEWGIYSALREKGIDVRDVNVTPSGVGFHVVFSIKKWSEGLGKNALMIALSSYLIKLAIVVDEDINVHDLKQVEWAVATRVQPHEDVVLIEGLWAKLLDPSLAMHPEPLTTSKLGIDATIPLKAPNHLFKIEDVPFEEELRNRTVVRRVK
jgi:2,5-furandicarboxylate decarboxylase 1